MKVRAIPAGLLVGFLLLSSIACGESDTTPTPVTTPTPGGTPTGTPDAATPTATPGTGDFTIHQWAVIDDGGAAAIEVRITSPGDCTVALTGPNGGRLDSGACASGTSEVKLKMSDAWVSPSAGRYRLLVNDGSGVEMGTLTFDFEGAALSVQDVRCTWELNPTGTEYTLTKMEFTAKNSGDLPVYVDKAVLRVRGRSGEIPLKQVVLPGMEELISDSEWKPYTRYVLGVPAEGTRDLYLKLQDASRQIFWTSADVDPESAHEITFGFSEWSVIDDEGYPALQGVVTAGDAVNLTIVDPADVERDWEFSNPGASEVTLRLGVEGEVPEAGTYKLVVADAWGNPVTSSSLTIQGANLTVTLVSMGWEPGLGAGAGKWYLTSIEFMVSNGGDVPAYISGVELVADGQSGLIEQEITALPGDTKTVTASTAPSQWWGFLGSDGLWGGGRTFSLRFTDSTDEFIHIHTQAISIPSAGDYGAGSPLACWCSVWFGAVQLARAVGPVATS